MNNPMVLTMMKFIFAAAMLVTLPAAAFAQQQPAPPPPAGPTVVQCNQGYKDGMQWTKEQFAAACLRLKQKNQGG